MSSDLLRVRRLWPIASSEDGIEWFECSRVGRIRARLAQARLIGEPLWMLDFFTSRAELEHMRPARCPIASHAEEYQGGDDDPPDECDCYHADEGWHYVCAADHPEAIAVWRVEWVRHLPRPIDALRIRLTRHRLSYRPVLWGATRRRAQLRLGEDRVARYRGWMRKGTAAS